MPDAPELNLYNILGKEKLPGLSQIDPDFYDKVAGLISELEAEKKRTEPGSIKDEEITDQLEVAKEQVMEIIQERMRKIIRIATSQAAKRERGDAPALTQEEKKLYNAFLSLMTVWRQDFDQLFGRTQGKIRKEPPNREKPAVPTEAKQKNRDISGYILVRLLTNVPTFVGMDNRNYTLAKEDVAVVPGVNARALIAKKAAVQIALQ
jgi:DNA replication factor GINS